MNVKKMLVFAVFVYVATAFSGWSILILLALVIIFYDQFLNGAIDPGLKQRHAIDFISSCPKAPKKDIPKWLMFPEYEKARFFNHIIHVLWDPHLKYAFEEKLRSKLEWKLDILKEKYKKISEISIAVLDLGTSAPLLSGIKTCEVKCDLCCSHIKHDRTNCKQKYCALEGDFVFSSDDLHFSLMIGYKKLKLSVNLTNVSLSGSIMFRIYDFVNVFPGFSSYGLSFLTYPNFDFNLSFQTGSFKLKYIPKVSRIIEPFLKRTVWTSMIYPAEKRFKIRSRSVSEMRKAGKLLKYGQRSHELEGSLVIYLRKVVWDKKSNSKETDHSKPEILEHEKEIFKDDLGYSWHVVMSIKGTKMVQKSHHIRSNNIMRVLRWNESFTFKNFTLGETSSLSSSPFLDLEIHFLGKQWDEIMGMGSIDLRLLIEKHGYKVQRHSLDIVRFFKEGEVGFKRVGKLVLDLTYLPPNSLSNGFLNRFRLRNVMLESIRDQNFHIMSSNLRKREEKVLNNSKLERVISDELTGWKKKEISKLKKTASR